MRENVELPPVPMSERDIKMWAVFMHLGVYLFLLTPLIIWLLKRGQSAFLDQTGKHVLNFLISYTLYYGILTILGIVMFTVPMILLSGQVEGGSSEVSPAFAMVIVAFFFALSLVPFAAIITGIIFTIMGAVKASEGKVYRYPLSIGFLK